MQRNERHRAVAVNGIGKVSIPVSDQQRALVFYRDHLGLQVVQDNSYGDDGTRWIELAPSGSSTATTLILASWFDSMPPGSLAGLLLHCDDVHATVANLEAAGVTIEMPPTEYPWGWNAVVLDPDANRLVLSTE